MKLRSIFLPDNKKFFTLFDKVALQLSQMSQFFLEAVSNENNAIEQYIKQLDELEKANDTITHKIFIELGRNFITPFDREDIHYLASGLDDIADAMLGTVKQMRSHHIAAERNGVAAEIAELNLKITELLCDAIMGLRNMRAPEKLNEKCNAIKIIITAANNTLDRAGYMLFHNGDDANSIIRKMDHYDRLQYLVKKCGDAINLIESIIIKYG